MQNPLDNVSQHGRKEMMELQRELASRRLESVRLYKPNANQVAIHECESKEIIILGGNRSGKTTAALVELAWALTGTHPIEGRYPKEGGVALVVGAGWRHIGMTIYPGLLKAGKFDIIKDEKTGEWRAFDPDADKDRAADKKPAPPLIPPRMIKQTSWVLKSAGFLQSVELTNGWTLYCLSSEGEPPQGFRADIVLFDEDLSSESTWLAEMQARLADRRGRFIWSATPHSKNDALFGLCERAEKAAEQGLENPKLFRLRFLDNNFIPEESRKLLIEQWAAQGEEVLRMRAEGQFTYDSILMYPNFSMGIHGFPRKELPDGQVPESWCRYAAVDPGHAVCAVLFVAVPPSGDFVLLYDELYIPNANAILFAEKFAAKLAGQPQHYAFLIDSHGARLTDIGGGRSPGQQYSEQLEMLGIRSKATGSSFMHGSDDVMSGVESVRNAMHIRANGTTKLRVLEGALPNFQREIARYKRQSTVVGGTHIITDKPHPRSVSHLMDCCRYIFAADPKYHKPDVKHEKAWWEDWLKKRRAARGEEANVVYLAPSSYLTESYVA
jgi:hypothetical protein